MGDCSGHYRVDYCRCAASLDHVMELFDVKPGCGVNMMPEAMVVGRCKDCKWWTNDNALASAMLGKYVKSNSDWGRCVRMHGEDTLMDDEEYGAVDTNAFFGCVMWESNE